MSTPQFSSQYSSPRLQPAEGGRADTQEISELFDYSVHQFNRVFAGRLHIGTRFDQPNVLMIEPVMLKLIRAICNFNFNLTQFGKQPVVGLRLHRQGSRHCISTDNFRSQTVVGDERQSTHNRHVDRKPLSRSRDFFVKNSWYWNGSKIGDIRSGKSVLKSLELIFNRELHAPSFRLLALYFLRDGVFALPVRDANRYTQPDSCADCLNPRCPLGLVEIPSEAKDRQSDYTPDADRKYDIAARKKSFQSFHKGIIT